MKRAVAGAALMAGVGAAELVRRRSKNRRMAYKSDTITSVRRHEEDGLSIEELSELNNESRPLFRNLKWPTLLGNVGIGAAEMLAGGGSMLSVTVDGVHNIGDGAGYGAQFYAEEAKYPERVRRLRKIGHWIIASSSAIVGAKAVYDLAVQNEHTAHPAGLIAAGASLALNGYLGRDIIPKVRRVGWRWMTSTQRDIAKHFLFVDAPSSVLAVGGAAAAHAGASNVSAIAAVVSGGLGAYVFRPTKHNLEEPHTCTTHGHEHSHDHANDNLTPIKEHASRRRRFVLALGAAAATVVAGIGIGPAPAAHAPVPSMADEAPPIVEADKPMLESAPLSHGSEIYTVQQGDSLWQIAEQKYCEDVCSNQRLVEYVVDLSEHNKLANPDLIYPGQELMLSRA